VSVANAAGRPPVNLLTKLLYGSGAMANQIKQQGLSMLLLLFYNQVVGIDARLVSTAIMVAVIFDAFCDPMVGQISDNFRSRLGRRHPFMFTAALPVSVAFFCIWNPPAGLSDSATFAYMLTCLLTIRLFDTFFELPSTALAPELVTDYDGRTRLLALRQMFGVIGTLTLTVSVYQVFMRQGANGSGGVTDRAGYLPFSIAAAVVIFSVIIISSLGTVKQIPYLAKAPERTTFSLRAMMREVGGTLKNRSFAVVAIAGMVLAIGSGVKGGLELYMGLFYWGMNQNQLTVLAMAQVFSSFAGVWLAPRVVKKLGKRVGAMTTGWISISLSVTPVLADKAGLMPTHGSTQLFLVLVSFYLCTQMFTTATGVKIQAMIADVVEDAAVRTGRRSEGLLFSADNLFKKAVSGVGILIAGQLLHFANFPENARQVGVEPSTLSALGWSYVLAWGFLNGGCLIALSFYNIDRGKHEENLRQLGLLAETPGAIPTTSTAAVDDALPQPPRAKRPRTKPKPV